MNYQIFVMNDTFSSVKLKTIFDYTFPFYSMFALHAVDYDTFALLT